MDHEEGASTLRMGIEVASRAEITVLKGSRTGPLKEKPAHIVLAESVM